MKRSKFFVPRGPRYLRAVDIPNDEVPWRIKQCREAAIGKPPEPKPVVDFHGDSRGLVLNATQWDVLEAAFGPESDDWIGHTVLLSTEAGVFRGGPRKGESYVTIRLRAVVDTPTKPADQRQPAPATANGLEHAEVNEVCEPSGNRDG